MQMESLKWMFAFPRQEIAKPVHYYLIIILYIVILLCTDVVQRLKICTQNKSTLNVNKQSNVLYNAWLKVLFWESPCLK